MLFPLKKGKKGKKIIFAREVNRYLSPSNFLHSRSIISRNGTRVCGWEGSDRGSFDDYNRSGTKVRCSGMKGTYQESDEEEAKPKKELWMSMVGEGSR